MKHLIPFLPYVFIAVILGFLVYILNLKKKKNNLLPFPDKPFFIFGVFCSLFVPILVVIALTLFYGHRDYIVLFAEIFILIIANLILVNIYTYLAKTLHDIGGKSAEISVSGIFVLASIAGLNFTFIRNVFLGERSSTDIFIILLIPFYGFLSIIVGYCLGYIIKKLKRDLKRQQY